MYLPKIYAVCMFGRHGGTKIRKKIVFSLTFLYNNTYNSFLKFHLNTLYIWIGKTVKERHRKRKIDMWIDTLLKLFTTSEPLLAWLSYTIQWSTQLYHIIPHFSTSVRWSVRYLARRNECGRSTSYPNKEKTVIHAGTSNKAHWTD